MDRERDATNEVFPSSLEESKPKETNRKKVSRRKFIVRGVFAVAGACALDATLLEPRWPQVTNTTIPIKGLGKEFEGFRIAILSDFHYNNHITADYIQHCMHLAADQSPDVMLFLGDFVHSKRYIGGPMFELPDIRGVFSPIPKTEFGAFGVLGNHDHWFDAAGVRRQLGQTPIQLIDNQNRIFRRGASSLAFVGTADFWEETINFENAFRGIPQEVPRILLQHNPDLAELNLPMFRVDLQVSGHTHGGQIRVPFGPALMLPSKYGNKYREGLVEGPYHQVYVSRGIGVSGPIGVRFCCRPEVTILTLVPA